MNVVASPDLSVRMDRFGDDEVTGSAGLPVTSVGSDRFDSAGT